MEITTQIFAMMQILIENHWKVRKCKLLTFLASFHYLDQISNPRPLDRWKFKIVLNDSPKIMDFAKNVLSKLALPILINDLFISFANKEKLLLNDILGWLLEQVLKDLEWLYTTYLTKIEQMILWAKIQPTVPISFLIKNKFKSKWRMITTCSLHQLLILPLDMIP